MQAAAQYSTRPTAFSATQAFCIQLSFTQACSTFFSTLGPTTVVFPGLRPQQVYHPAISSWYAAQQAFSKVAYYPTSLPPSLHIPTVTGTFHNGNPMVPPATISQPLQYQQTIMQAPILSYVLRYFVTCRTTFYAGLRWSYGTTYHLHSPTLQYPGTSLAHPLVHPHTTVPGVDNAAMLRHWASPKCEPQGRPNGHKQTRTRIPFAIALSITEYLSVAYGHKSVTCPCTVCIAYIAIQKYRPL